MMLDMGQPDRIIRIEMTHDEAYELLLRCLQSPEQDTPIFHSAIQVLARSIKDVDTTAAAAS